MSEKDNKGFSLEEILEEQRRMKETGALPREEISPNISPENTKAEEYAFTGEDISSNSSGDGSAFVPDSVSPYGEQDEEEPIREEGVKSDTADLNSFATGNISIPGYTGQSTAGGEPSKKGKKKKRGGLFGRKHKVPDFEDGEDMYYGIQLKPIDEYRRGFDSSTGELPIDDDYKVLFDDSKQAIDDEVEENFHRLQQERRRRVAQAVENAGVDKEQLIDEFGVVAPMPVTSYAADPYAKQYGIDLPKDEISGDEIPDFQKAIMETSADKTMEMMLNVENNTVELHRVKDIPSVSDESMNKILDAAEHSGYEPSAEETQAEAAGAEYEELSSLSHADAQEGGAAYEEISSVSRQPERPVGEIPQVASIYEYRVRGIPNHVINADVLQSALLSESEALSSERPAEKGNRRVRNRKLTQAWDEEHEYTPEELQESIEDYTGPEDARSIASELKGDMRELTVRMMITGVCTLLLTIVNLIFSGTFSGMSGDDPETMPIVYIILTLVFSGVCVGVCYRTILNGLRALLSFNANSDSAAAVAAVAVLVQTVTSIFFTSDIVEGNLHLYAVVLSGILFVNAAGKLTMIRRIHSNFRFITSREQKYSVRTFDDYNTSLKMVKEAVADKPLVAYQCKAGFLKRFLELSYTSDPAEKASQFMAPITLIASLALCIVCLLITKSVPAALSAFAASSCVCVAVSNMLSVNLIVSRLCRSARRAGAMVVGYEAIAEMGDVNAVLIDSEDIFPRGTVVLDGIKTFGDRKRAEDAVMSASALMREVGGPLAGVFDQVISENEDALPEVRDISYEDENGIIGRVDNKRIYIGTRGLMVNHRIEVPPREEELRFSAGSKIIVYLAMDSDVVAMLVLTYTADRSRKNELQRLENSGISVVIRTTDPNVSLPLISRLFGIDSASATILKEPLSDTADRLMSQEVPRSDAKVATKGRVESMMNVISACVYEKSIVSFVVMIQNIALILGFVLVAFMACFGGMPQLSSAILFFFELFWLLVIIVIPKLRRS